MLRKVLSFPFMPRGSGAYDPPALRRQLENLVSTLTRVLGEHGSTINRLVDTANALPPHNDGFEEGEPNLLQKDHSHVTPIGWRFIHHSQGSFNLFGYSQLTPANSPGSYSYGSETFYAAMGSWSIAKEYQVHGGGSLTVSVQVRANKNGPWVAPGAGEDFYAEDDGFLIIEEFTGTGDLYKRTFSTTASHQEYDRNGDYNYQDFVECSHTLTVLDRTSYVRVTLVATDKTNSPGPIPVYSPNANVLFDDFSFTYDRKYYDITMFGGIHEHSEMYAYGSASASNLVLTDSYQAVKGIWSGVSLQDPNYSFDTSTGVLTILLTHPQVFLQSIPPESMRYTSLLSFS